MKVLIATPCYGGLLTHEYVSSLIETQKYLIHESIEYGTCLLANEALIGRARNKCAKMAIDHGYTHLFFIDADISWRYAQFKRILGGKGRVTGGTYPMKTLPIALNFNPISEDAHYFESRKSEENMVRFVKEKGEEIKVRHIPTGFLKIEVSVFKELAERKLVESYKELDITSGDKLQNHDYFPTQVKNNILESEDWAFCSKCNDAGIDIIMNGTVIVNHTGSYTFKTSL